MTSLIAMVSLLLCIILMVAVYQLFKQVQSIKIEKQDEIHNIMQFYLDEIKEENDRLERNIKLNSDQDSNKHKTKHVEEYVEKVKINEDPTEMHKAEGNSEIDILNLIEEEDLYEPSIASQIFQLKSEGHSIEEISKKLKCGKTEVELMLKLRK